MTSGKVPQSSGLSGKKVRQILGTNVTWIIGSGNECSVQEKGPQ